MSNTQLAIIVHGLLALAIVIAATVLAVDLRTIPADVAGLFGVVLGAAGINGSAYIADRKSGNNSDKT